MPTLENEVFPESLSIVALAKDLPEHQLKSGDIGAVVECYGAEAVEVEFVTGSGRTIAVLTLQSQLLRDIGDNDVLAVRKSD